MTSLLSYQWFWKEERKPAWVEESEQVEASTGIWSDKVQQVNLKSSNQSAIETELSQLDKFDS